MGGVRGHWSDLGIWLSGTGGRGEEREEMKRMRRKKRRTGGRRRRRSREKKKKEKLNNPTMKGGEANPRRIAITTKRCRDSNH